MKLSNSGIKNLSPVADQRLFELATRSSKMVDRLLFEIAKGAEDAQLLESVRRLGILMEDIARTSRLL